MDCKGHRATSEIDRNVMYLDCGHNFMGLYIFQNALYTLHRCSYVHKLYLNIIVIKKEVQGFPGGAVVKNLPADVGHTELSPGLGRSHMPWSNKARAPQLLSLHSRAHVPQLLKPVRLEPVLRSKATTTRSPCATTKSSPRWLQLERARAQKQRPNTAKNK